MRFVKSMLLLLIGIALSVASVPICYCKNGIKSSNSTNPSQCECSVPTGECGDNEAYVPEGDALTYAEATGECGNFAHAEGKEARAVIHSGKSNRAVVYRSDYGVAEIEGGEGNQAHTWIGSGNATIIGGNSTHNNIVASRQGQVSVKDGVGNSVNARYGCRASVENSTSNWVDCTDESGRISLKNAKSNTIWTKNGCLASVESGGDNEVACENEGGQASVKNGESNIVVANDSCEASVENGNGNNVTCNSANDRAYVFNADDCIIWTWFERLSCSNNTDGITFQDGRDLNCEWNPYSAPICYCKNGVKSSNSTNPSQCECSVPTGDCGDNEALVSVGDTLTYAEATGECGNHAHAKGNESIAVIHSGKSNHASAQSDFSVAEIEGGESNVAGTFRSPGTAKIFGINAKRNNVVANDGGQASVNDGENNQVTTFQGCQASVENSTGSLVDCKDEGGEVFVKNSESTTVWTKNGCLALVENSRDNEVVCEKEGGKASIKNGESNVVKVNKDCKASVENGIGNTVTCNFANSRAYVLDANNCNISTWLELLSCSNDTDGIFYEDGKDLDCEWVPICYCQNGLKWSNSTNPSQCECSVPTGDCGDNEAYVPEGDALTYAEAIGECGNFAHADGNESRAIIRAGKSNRATAQSDYGVAEIEGGENNWASTFRGPGTAKVFGFNAKSNKVAATSQGQAVVKDGEDNHVNSSNGCQASIENSTSSWVTCGSHDTINDGGQVTIENGESNQVSTKNGCYTAIENGKDNKVRCENEGGQASIKNGESNLVVVNDSCEASVEMGYGNNVTCNFANSRAYALDADNCTIWTWLEPLSCSNDTDGIAFEEGRDLDCVNVTKSTP